MSIILDSILATDRKNNNIRLFLGDTFENVIDREKKYTITKFIFGKHHLLELNNVLYGILQIDQNNNSMTIMDIDENLVTIQKVTNNL